MTKEEVAQIVVDAKELVSAHERRSPTSKRSTLGEESAMFNLYVRLRQLYSSDIKLERV